MCFHFEASELISPTSSAFDVEEGTMPDGWFDDTEELDEKLEEKKVRPAISKKLKVKKSKIECYHAAVSFFQQKSSIYALIPL